LYVNHDYRALALAATWNGTVRWVEDSHGVLMDAELNPNRQDCNDVACALDDKLATVMSFGFRMGSTGRDSWSQDQSVRTITRFGELSDFSILTVQPAYDATEVGLRAAGDSLARELRFVNQFVSEARAGKKHSAATKLTVSKAVGHLVAAGVNMDAAHEHLAGLLTDGGLQDGTYGSTAPSASHGGPGIGSDDGTGSRAAADWLKKERKRVNREAAINRADEVAKERRLDNERLFTSL
jgi:HK97 family phage prohead protease